MANTYLNVKVQHEDKPWTQLHLHSDMVITMKAAVR